MGRWKWAERHLCAGLRDKWFANKACWCRHLGEQPSDISKADNGVSLYLANFWVEPDTVAHGLRGPDQRLHSTVWLGTAGGSDTHQGTPNGYK